MTLPLDPNGAPDWEALARYDAGESPDGERAAIEKWLGENAADAAMLDALKAATAKPEQVAEREVLDFQPDVEAALRRVQSRIAEPVVERQVIPFRDRQRSAEPMRRRWVPAALAAAAAIGAVAIGLQRARTGGNATDLAELGSLRLASAGEVISTKVGQRDSVRLADGTKIVLAPSTRLTVDVAYGQSARTVTIDGAAVFSVQHDERRPFAVHAGDALVSDLGTVFQVRTSTTPKGPVSVSVREGKVALVANGRPAAEQVVMGAGDRGELFVDGRVTLAHATGTISEELAWTSGRLSYRAVPLERFVDDVRRWYGVSVRVEDATLAQRTVTTTFSEHDAVDHVLEVAALAVGARVDREGAGFVVRGTEQRAR